MPFWTRLRRSPIASWPLLGALVVCLGMVAGYLAVQPKLWDGKHFLGWDIIQMGWPNLDFIYQSLRDGNLPLWNPYGNHGYAFVNDPEAAAFYPVSYLMAGLQGLFGRGPWIILTQVLTHVAIGGLGMYLYLSRYALPRPARWTSSLAYVLSARLAKSKDQTVLGTVSWFPWMMIAIEELVRKPSWRSGTLLGVVVGTDLLAGYPPNCFRNLVALAIVFVYEVVVVLPADRGERRAHLWRLTKSTGLAVVIALALTAPMLMGLLDTYTGSIRAALPMHEVLRSSLHVGEALMALVPGLRAPNSLPLLYLGVIPAILALVALTKANGRRMLWGGVAALFFLFACGGNSFVLPLMARVLSPFKLFRIPEQYLFISCFFVCVLAAHGMHDLLRAPRLRRRLAWILGIVGVLTLSALLFHQLASRPPRELPAAKLSLLLLLAAGLCLWGLGGKPRRARVAAWLCVPLLLLDLGVQLRPIYNIVQRYPDLRRHALVPGLPGLSNLQYAALDLDFGFRVGIMHGIREGSGRNTALVSQRFEDFRVAAFFRRNSQFLAATNTRYLLGPRWRPRNGRMVRPGIYELQNVAPFAFWDGAPELLRNKQEVFARLSANTQPPRALLERGDLDEGQRQRLASLRSSAAPVAARLVGLDNNNQRVVVDAPGPGVVVMHQSFAPGWRFTVNGKPARAFRANFMFRGVFVPAGRSEIRASFRPTRILAAGSVWAVTWLLLIGFALRGWWRRRRGRSGSAGGDGPKLAKAEPAGSEPPGGLDDR